MGTVSGYKQDLIKDCEEYVRRLAGEEETSRFRSLSRLSTEDLGRLTQALEKAWRRVVVVIEGEEK